MAITVGCPVPTALTSVITSTNLNPCPMVFGQIQRMIFWKAGNSIVVASVVTSSKWTTLAAATGTTKALFSPLLGKVEFKIGESRSFGGGADTLNGSPQRIGLEPTEVTGRFYYADQPTVLANIRKLEAANLEVLFVNEANQLLYKLDTTAKGFPIEQRSLIFKDLNPGDRSTPPYNEFVFNLAPQWTSGLQISAASTFLLTMVNT